MFITTDPQKQDPDVTIAFCGKAEIKRSLFLKRLGSSFKVVTKEDVTLVSTKNVKTTDDWRELGYAVVKHLNSINVRSAKIPLPNDCGAFVEGLVLGNYQFTYYKSKPKKQKLKYIHLTPTEKHQGNFDTAVGEALVRADAQLLVRDMVNGTPEDMNSLTILDEVEGALLAGDSVELTVYEPADLARLGMAGHLAVNRASKFPARTYKLEYEPHEWKKHIILVGKGLTFDSGGLSLKVGAGMEGMKCDKAGAMTVFGIMAGIGHLGSDYKVTAYMAMAENMINQDSYRVDDILTMKNGKTVHVKNTDAEGRIVLFDNLCLAEEEYPDFDEIYTFATLTGAAVFQFGSEACGMVGYNDKMKKKIKKIGEEEGEVFCNAEFHKFMMNSVDDKIADLSNTGTKNQGCQKAGLFLTKALSRDAQKKYLHLDIAGPAFAKSPFGTNIAGGTGFAVRTLLNYLTR